MNMKYKIAVGAIASVLAIAIVLSFEGKEERLGAFVAPGFNSIDTVTHTVTTTHGSLPVQLMATNTSRIYGLIVNGSDTNINLYFGSFADPLQASTTVSSTSGFLVAPNGSYEIVPENIYSGAVWASSTAPSKRIYVTEK